MTLRWRPKRPWSGHSAFRQGTTSQPIDAKVEHHKGDKAVDLSHPFEMSRKGLELALSRKVFDGRCPPSQGSWNRFEFSIVYAAALIILFFILVCRR